MPNEDGTPTAEEAAAAEAAAAAAKNKPWYDSLDADLKSNPSVQKFKDVGGLAKSYLELEKTLGKDKIVIPTDKSSKEEIAAFWRKLGAPEKEEDYNVADDDLHEDVRIAPEAKKELQRRARELGIPKKQFEELFGTYKKLTANRFNQELEKIKGLAGETETSLRGEWGAAYEAKVAGAQKVIDTFFKNKGIRKEFSVLASDKGFVAAMAEIADAISEDKIAGKPRLTQTPEEATSELNAIMGDMKGPYYNELHPEHDAMIEKVLKLQRLIAAGQA